MLRRSTANGLALSLAILLIGCLVAILWLLRAPGRGESARLAALSDEEIRAEAVRELVATGPGIFDSFPDPDVGRLLQPGLRERAVGGGVLSSNRWGLREREYLLPKPEGTLRIVFLGDSYVHGNGVAPEDRCGVFLERFLEERATGPWTEVEVLHLGVPSWNILAETSYLRRQLDGLRPDLVIHVVVPNDLDDCAGVRGFGSMAAYSPQVAVGGAGILTRDFPARRLGFPTRGYLAHGLDEISRARYVRAAGDIGRLAAAVEAQGGRYLLLLNWMRLQPVGRRWLTRELREEQVALLPYALYEEPDYRVSARDGHWNREGHRQVALLGYELIRERQLLPAGRLEAWTEASERARWMREAAAAELRAASGSPPDASSIGSEIDLRDLDPSSAAQIHGGIYGDLAGPRASFILRNPRGRWLRVEGYFLPDRSLEGMSISVELEDRTIGTLVARPGERFAVDLPVPGEFRSRPHLGVTLRAEDHVYRAAGLRLCVSLGLERLALHAQAETR